MKKLSMKKAALVFTGVFTVIMIYMIYVALPKAKSPFINSQTENLIELPVVSEFSSKSPEATWQTFTHEKYKYSFSYPPEFSLSEPVSSQGKIVDIVRLFYNKKTAVGVFKVISGEVQQQEKQEGKDADGNEVVTYKFPLAKNTLVFQATVFTQLEGKTKFDRIIEQIAGTVQTQQ